MQYDETINSINAALSFFEKSAEEAPSAPGNLQPKDVLQGDRQKTHGQGTPVAGAEGDDEVTTLQAEPSRTDPGKKSTEYLLQGESKTGPSITELADDYEKSSSIETNLLRGLEALLTKSAKDGEYDDDYSEKDKDKKKKKKEEEKKSGYKCASDDEDMEYTEEEKEKMKEMTEEEKEEYMMDKEAGYALANKLIQNGTLQKMAMAMIAPHLDQVVSHEVGRALYHLEKQGFFNQGLEKRAEQLAGGYIANLKNRGIISVNEAALSGQTKQASHQDARSIIKEAAYQTTEQVLQDLTKKKMGSEVNNLLSRLANPQ